MWPGSEVVLQVTYITFVYGGMLVAQSDHRSNECPDRVATVSRHFYYSIWNYKWSVNREFFKLACLSLHATGSMLAK
jgi:hypothetical protein